MRRADIPNGVLQVTDLKPNTSQRSFIYDPGKGQSGYVRQIPISSTILSTGGAASALITNAQGLSAYLVDVVEDSGGAALTDAVANAAAAAIEARARAGLALALANVDAAIVAAGATAGTGLEAGASTGLLSELLNALQGALYEVPAGAVLNAAGVFIPTRRGSFAPDVNVRVYYVTGEFNISNGEGVLWGLQRTDFSYQGTLGAAITVYADDGALY
jgi:hypothetical protein